MICIFNLLKFYFHVFIIFCLQILNFCVFMCLCSLLLVVFVEKFKGFFTVGETFSAFSHVLDALNFLFLFLSFLSPISGQK